MSDALTFLFKEIIPDKMSFWQFIKEYEIADDTPENENFSNYLFKIIYRRFANSNVQYYTIEEFKNDFANVLEDAFEKYKNQINLINMMHDVTPEELREVSEAIANAANNPNNKVDNPRQPLEYVGAQTFTIAKTNKLQAYLTALNNIPTKLIGELLTECSPLFKRIQPNKIFIYGEN